MATLNFQFVSVCAGGGHVTIDGSFNGGATLRTVYGADDLRQPLSALSADDIAAFALTVLKIHFAGQTRAQIGTALNAGVTVTI